MYNSNHIYAFIRNTIGQIQGSYDRSDLNAIAESLTSEIVGDLDTLLAMCDVKGIDLLDLIYDELIDTLS